MAAPQTVEPAGMEQLATILKTLSEAQAQAIREAIKAGVQEVNPKRDNPNYVEDSIYRPKGVVKPALTRRVFWNRLEEEDAMLTPEEVSLYNEVKPGRYPIRIGGLPRTIEAVEIVNGSTPELRIEIKPMTQEDRATLPSLKRILRALIAGVTEIEQ